MDDRRKKQVNSLIEDCLDKISDHYEDDEADDRDKLLLLEYIAGKLKIAKDITK